MAKEATQARSKVDTDADRYPVLKDVLRRMLDEAEFPDAPIERMEVTTLASGEASWRIFRARAEEAELGYMPPAQS